MLEEEVFDIHGLEQRLQQMLARQKQCQELAHYGEAGVLEQKIKITRAEINKQKLLELRRRHRDESNQLDKEMKIQLKRFHQFQKEKFKSHEKQNTKIQEEMLKLHRDQMAEYRQDLSCRLPILQRESGSLLSLKRREEQFVKQKQYQNAQQMRSEHNKRRQEEIQKSKAQRSNKIKNLIRHLEERQQLERNVLHMRTEESYKMLVKDLNIEREKMLLRHKNIRCQVRAQQQRECLQVQGKLPSRPMQSLAKTTIRSS